MDTIIVGKPGGGMPIDPPLQSPAYSESLIQFQNEEVKIK